MPLIPFKLRYVSVLLFLLLVWPTTARADALSGMFELLINVVSLVMTALGVTFTLLAYFRPASRGLQLMNGLLLVATVMLGLLWEAKSSSFLTRGSIPFNPFLNIAMPLAAWLGGVSRAGKTTPPKRRLVWVAVAVFGAAILLDTGTHMLLKAVFGRALFQTPNGYLWWWLLDAPVLAGVWWLVLQQVQRQHPLHWHRTSFVWLAPALEAGLAVLYSFFLVGLSLGTSYATLSDPAYFVATMLAYGLLRWATGAAAVHLNQQRQPALLRPDTPAPS